MCTANPDAGILIEMCVFLYLNMHNLIHTTVCSILAVLLHTSILFLRL